MLHKIEHIWSSDTSSLSISVRYKLLWAHTRKRLLEWIEALCPLKITPFSWSTGWGLPWSPRCRTKGRAVRGGEQRCELLWPLEIDRLFKSDTSGTLLTSGGIMALISLAISYLPAVLAYGALVIAVAFAIHILSQLVSANAKIMSSTWRLNGRCVCRLFPRTLDNLLSSFHGSHSLEMLSTLECKYSNSKSLYAR